MDSNNDPASKGPEVPGDPDEQSATNAHTSEIDYTTIASPDVGVLKPSENASYAASISNSSIAASSISIPVLEVDPAVTSIPCRNFICPDNLTE